MNQGFVSIVGAGPGHPDDLTLRGWKALQRAEVILYDALLHPSFRRIFPREARSLFVGKRAGLPATGQDEINRRLLLLARQGRRVVRLKGGDPLIFGRGGEEYSYLREHGVPAEIIPGLTAANGVGALAGIPLTHRGVSGSVLIVEGQHLAKNGPPLRDMASFPGTIVVYMASRKARVLAQQLLAHGVAPDIPLAMVETDPQAGQVISRSTLGEAAEQGLARKTNGPGIIYIGRTVSLQLAAGPLTDTESSQILENNHAGRQ